MSRVLTAPDESGMVDERDRANLSTGKLDEPHQEFTSTGGRSYAESRLLRLRRGRLAGFAVFVPLWVLSVVPLARESMDGRGGVDLVLVYLAVGAITLGAAVAIRGAYVLLMKRRFWSPWLFVLAAFVAIVGYTVQSAGEEQVPFEGAPAAESTVDGSAGS